jgi:hypothetical protein
MTSNAGMIDDLSVGKDLEGRDRRHVKGVLFRRLLGRTEKQFVTNLNQD